MEKGERKISNDAAIMMLAVAVFLDIVNILAELIPFAGIFIGGILDIIIAGVFYIWFDHYEVKLFAGKNMWGSFAALAANAFPITDLAFPWAIRVGMLAFSARKEMPEKTVRPSVSGWRL